MAVTGWAKPTIATSTTWAPYDTSLTLAQNVQEKDISPPTWSTDVPHAYTPCPCSGLDILVLGGFHDPLGTPISIPGGSTINGIEVKLTCAIDGCYPGFALCDPPDDTGYQNCLQAGLCAKPNAPGSTQRCGYASSDVGLYDRILGGPTDLWGGSWTAELANSIAFDVYPAGSLLGPTKRLLDYFWVRIWYTPGEDPPPDPVIMSEAATRYIPGVTVTGSPSVVKR